MKLIKHGRNVHELILEKDNYKIAMLSDLHWDNPKCDRDLLKKHLDHCKQENIPVMINGDMFCLMQGRGDNRRNKSDIRPEHNNARYLDSVVENQELELNEEDSRKIVWQAKDFSIREFASMLQDGDLDLQPEYQRKYVATPKIARKLIESVIMDVPIPVNYLAEEQDGTYSVIDGQQRLTSFLSFMNGKYPDGGTFKLTGLKVYKELNRKTFSER